MKNSRAVSLLLLLAILLTVVGLMHVYRSPAPRPQHETESNNAGRQMETNNGGMETKSNNGGCELKRPFYFHSQGGEDVILFERYFSNPLKCDGTFVEMGAWDGVNLSVSLFYENHLNWNGILVDANPENFKLVQKNRPNTFNYGVAVGDCQGGAINFTGSDAMGKVLDKNANPFLVSLKAATIRIPCVPMSELLKRSGTKEIDLFVLDVEGSEIKVLRTMDWTIPVKVWIIEVNHSPHEPIIEILNQHGYYQTDWDFGKTCNARRSHMNGNSTFITQKMSCTPSFVFVAKPAN